MSGLFRYILFFLALALVSISCQTPSSDLPKTSDDSMVFTQIKSDHTGVDFMNKIEESAFRNSMFFDYFMNGAGVAIGDVNNDGLADLFFTGNDVNDRLFINKGNLEFNDVSESALPELPGWSTGANMVDINNDGFLDIFVCRSGMEEKDGKLRNLLLINNGDLTFSDKASEYGLTDEQLSIHSSFFDFDKDGDLDLWLNNHVNFDGNVMTLFDNMEKSHTDRKKYRSCLYENRNGKFVDITETAGVSRESASLGVSTTDLNGDGWIDIYVSNDYDIPDYYFLNNGDKTFSEVSKEKMGHTSFYSMGLDAADLNNDLMLDLVAVDMTPQDHVRNKVLMASMDSKKFQFLYDVKGLTKSYMFNTVQYGVGEGNFSEVGNYLGVSQTEWSWAPLIADFDNDGNKDLYVTNGYLRDTKDNDFKNKVEEYKKEKGGEWNEEVYAYFQSIINSTPVDNKLFKNKNGKLKDVTDTWTTVDPTFSNGGAYGDLDNDGDLDLVINNIDQEALILRNDVSGKNFAQIKLESDKGNVDITNAEVIAYTPNYTQRLDYAFSRGYQSSVQQLLHFGLGDEELQKIVVKWLDGSAESFEDVSTNSLNVLQKGKGKVISENKSQITPLFVDQTEQVVPSGIMHEEMKFDDFAKEILLPHKYSDLGPALAVGDVNGDGFDDVFLGGSNTSESRLLLNDGSTLREVVDIAIQNDKRYEDLGALFFDYNNDDHLDLYVASGGGGEIEDYPELTKDRLYKNDGTGKFIDVSDVLPVTISSTKSVVAFDADNDGDKDLLIGGRNTPGKYPVDAKSYYLENANGIFRDRTKKVFSNLPGMITDIEVGDINDDGFIDVIVVGEWTSPMIYINKNGSFEQQSIPALIENRGWWQSVQASDLDNDGDIDFVLGNMGENTKFHPSKVKPLGVLASDFDDSGSLDIVLTKKYKDKTVPVRGKECSSEQMPMLKEKFGTYEGFATSSIEEILGEEKIENAYSRSVTDFSSYILINEGKLDFSIQKLPNEAQYFPVMDIVVADVNKDEHKDIILVGNKINSEPETPSYDAGKGLVLIGDGKLNFNPVNSIQKSGINAKYDGRAAALLNQKGNEPLLLIANNNGPIQIYKTID